jgi:Tfp pilus assembly protein FimT
MRITIFKNKKPAFTLLEAMLSIAIFSIGMVGFAMLFAKTWRTNSYSIEMGQSSLQVSRGVNMMGNFIRSARQGDDGSYPIVSASGNSFTIFSDYNKDGITERLHLYKTGTDILMGITNPTSTMPKTYPSGDQKTVTIATHIVNQATEPVFFYFNKYYPGDTAHNPLSAPITIADVRLVKIFLHINIDPNRPPDNIQMQTFIEMRNLNDYDKADQ